MSQQQQPAHKVVTASRPLDAFYDPTTALAGPRDYHKAAAIAMSQNQQVTRGCTENPFSELVHYPRSEMRVTNKRAPPAHVFENMGRHTQNVDTSQAHLGASLCLYLKKPITETNFQTLASAVHFDKSKELQSTQDALFNTFDNTHNQQEEEYTGPRDVEVQTMYRESEAQTDPCTLPYTVAPGQDPEVLTIAHLSYGSGSLPASKYEIALIEKMREKRQFDNLLPPSTDEFSYQLRAKLMEASEFREWAEREQAIKDLQDKRLEIIKVVLAERTEIRTEQEISKVHRLRAKGEADRDVVFSKCNKARVHVLRSLFRKRGVLSDGRKKRNIVDDYADFSSDVYAGKLYNGTQPDSKTAKIEVQPGDLSSLQGLNSLEQTMPGSFQVRVNEIEDVVKRNPHQQKKDDAMMRTLEAAMNASIAKEKQRDDFEEVLQDGNVVQQKKKINQILERPETPTVKGELFPEQEDKELAYLMLQRVMRGRAYQNIMFEGKEKRLHLINELRLAEQWTEDQEIDENQQREEELRVFRERAYDGIVEGLQGQVVASTLDQLSKELQRFQEERRIAVMVKKAERDRRLRQACESGRRQAEERLREREDEMFRQVMGVHQGTVDSYLESVIVKSVDQSAKAGALTEAELRAEQINNVVDKLEQQQQSDDAVCRQLVQDFLKPYVSRNVVQRNIKQHEKMFANVSRDAIEAVISNVQAEVGHIATSSSKAAAGDGSSTDKRAI